MEVFIITWRLILQFILAPCIFGGSNLEHFYLDVVPANTSYHLEVIRQLPISTFRLSYERSRTDRVRVGLVGTDALSIVPEAVEVLPKHVFRPSKTGDEKSTTVTSMPIVNENMLFYYGIGATQEISAHLDVGFETISKQTDRISQLYAEVYKVEQLLKRSTDGKAEAQIRASAAKAKLAQAEIELEEQRLKEDEEYSKALAQSQMEQIRRSEELVIQRLIREDEAAKERAEEYLKKKVETSQMVETARMQAAEVLSAIEHERAIELQKANEKMKSETAKAIATARAEAERANEDVHLRRIQAESEQRQKRNLAAIQTIFANLSTAFSAAANNPAKVFTFIGYITLFFASVYASRESARLCRILLEAALGKPKLVRETTRVSFLRAICKNFLSLGNRSGNANNKPCQENFRDLVLPEALKKRVLTIAKSARHARRNRAPHRHMLLYGPPGTGKTLVAKKIAECVGMDYALMSGGDVGPLGSDAVTQIHALFSWAKMSQKGVLLFIDEAEAFLGSRSKYSMSECAHNALNAILYNTGGERRDFMLILATNRADDLDAAILDRCDESLYFPCPDRSCRIMLLQLYFQTFVQSVVDHHNSRKSEWAITRGFKCLFSRGRPSLLTMKVDDGVMSGIQLEKAADATAGFSGREISKLMVAMQSALYSCDKTGTLTKEDAWGIVATKVQEHKEKKIMVSGGSGMISIIPGCASDAASSRSPLSQLTHQNEDDVTEVAHHEPEISANKRGKKMNSIASSDEVKAKKKQAKKEKK